MSDEPRVLVLLPEVPNVRGGAERQADALCSHLNAAGARADVFTAPFRWEPKEIVIGETLNWRLLELEADLVVPIKFPAYFVRHSNKVAWIAHQFRQLYEFHGTPLSAFANTPPDHELREKLVEMETRCLRECRAVYAISDNVAGRLRRYNGIAAEPMLVPPMMAGSLGCESYGGFLLAVGRLEENKRFDLLLRAAAQAGGDFEIKIVGGGSQEKQLKQLAEELGIAARVEFLGVVDDEELAGLYNTCGAVHFAPLDEDYGLIAAEAMLAGKPVITATDSGGPLELVTDGETGVVAAPDVESQAEAIARLMGDAKLCERLGAAGAEVAGRITWDGIVEKLLGWVEQ